MRAKVADTRLIGESSQRNSRLGLRDNAKEQIDADVGATT